LGSGFDGLYNLFSGIVQGDDLRARYFYGYSIVAAGFVIQAVSMGALFA
jgi:hypothetical protein